MFAASMILAVAMATVAPESGYDVAEWAIRRDGNTWVLEGEDSTIIQSQFERIVLRVHSHRTCIAFEFDIGMADPFTLAWCIDRPATSCPGDLTGDNVVGFPDYNELVYNWGQTCN